MTGFAREVRVDTIGTTAREIALEANAAERAELARRFDIASLDALTASASVSVQSDEIRATGQMSALLVQLCVATNVPLPAAIDVPFDVVFRKDAPDAAAEVELSEGECDVVFYEGGAIDLGEAIAETLALAIDPYPRSADADAVLKGVWRARRGAGGPVRCLGGIEKVKSSQRLLGPQRVSSTESTVH